MPIWLSWKRVIFEKRGAYVSLLFIPPAIAAFIWLRRSRHLCRFLKSLWPAKTYKTYRSALQEDQYWTTATMYGHRLQRSDARFSGSKGATESAIQVVTFYIPALLPRYRQKERKAMPEYFLSLRSLCKWHRMVFPGPGHPNISQASKLREGFSLEDRQEIHRISRMRSDELVFGAKAGKWKPKYRIIWRKWLTREDRKLCAIHVKN
ncbi:hypothetical protein C8F04DRAFT_996952 [Mycena alexandri]|uniref:Uncharacterized protein n=1 Tax=Mycena alexandri TaxID=1745969 RepID=A0AAD6T4W7_9AGAR|nr:hypothetical protein C8F04DRAFT_996952 [Mycena alexandri]